MSHLPARIRKVKPIIPLEVAVETSEKIVSTEEAHGAMQRLGLEDISPTVISDLESVGIHVKGVGVLKLQRGRAMVTQQRLDTIFKKIVEITQSGRKNKKGELVPLTVSELANAARAAGYIASKQTESQKFAVEMERVRATTDSMADDEEPPIQSFKPGAKVTPKMRQGTTAIVAQPGSNIHIHQGNPVAAPPPEKKV